MGIIHLTSANFKEEALKANGLVLVDFWAKWCGPCRVIAPIFEELARDLDGKLKFAKLDVDEAGQVASSYGVMSIPTLMFFKEGKVIDQVSGALSKAELKKKIEENLR